MSVCVAAKGGGGVQKTKVTCLLRCANRPCPRPHPYTDTRRCLAGLWGRAWPLSAATVMDTDTAARYRLQSQDGPSGCQQSRCQQHHCFQTFTPFLLLNSPTNFVFLSAITGPATMRILRSSLPASKPTNQVCSSGLFAINMSGGITLFKNVLFLLQN